MTQTHYHAAAPSYPAAPPSYPAPPTPPQVDAAPPDRRNWVLPILTLVVAIAAAVMAGIALARQPESQAVPTPQSRPAAPQPSEADVAAAKQDACMAWNTASTAMIAARKPFLDSAQPGVPWSWNDPAVMSTLSQAQSGILAQVEYLRQHVAPETPLEVAGPVGEFITANIDLIALDGQRETAAVANGAAERSNAAASKIRAACGN